MSRWGHESIEQLRWIFADGDARLSRRADCGRPMPEIPQTSPPLAVFLPCSCRHHTLFRLPYSDYSIGPQELQKLLTKIFAL